MKIGISMLVLLGLLLSVASLSGVLASDKQNERARCAECGMFADSSSTRIQAVLKSKGKVKNSEFCCVACLDSVLLAGGTGLELIKLKVLDYASFGSKSPRMLDGIKAFFLYDTKPLRGSMLPPVAAFSTKKEAESAQKELGGELIEGWSAVRQLLAQERAEKKDD